MIIPHSKPTISSTDARIVADVVKSGFISQGKHVQAFEKKYAQFLKVKHALAVNSGTSALHLSLLALKVGKGDNVIIPSYVCTALYNAVCATGATVRLADIGMDYNISPESVQKKINKKTKAIIVPHMYGLSADLTPLLKSGVPIIEDCAQSIGAKYNGKRVGSFGLISIGSFYATKMITTGEGGMIATNNRTLMNHMQDLREYDHKNDIKLRFNYKMTDMQAALGIRQLSQLPAWIKKRQAIANTFNNAIDDSPYHRPLEFTRREHVYYRYVVQTKNKSKLINTLKKKGIHAASPLYRPLHKYLQLSGYPTSDHLWRTSVSIPIYPALSKDAVRHITKHIR